MTIFDKLTNLATQSKIIKLTVVISISLVIIGWVTTVIIFASYLSTQSQKIYLINSDGSILTASQIDTNQSRPKEAEAHVRLFIKLFFEVNKLSYVSNYNQSLDLGGSSIRNLYNQLETNGWIKELVSNNYIVAVDIKKIHTTNSSSPYVVTSEFTVSLESEITTSTTYDLALTFTVRAGSGNNRHLNNPHDMQIDDINVIQWNQIK